MFNNINNWVTREERSTGLCVYFGTNTDAYIITKGKDNLFAELPQIAVDYLGEAYRDRSIRTEQVKNIVSHLLISGPKPTREDMWITPIYIAAQEPMDIYDTTYFEGSRLEIFSVRKAYFEGPLTCFEAALKYGAEYNISVMSMVNVLETRTKVIEDILAMAGYQITKAW